MRYSRAQLHLTGCLARNSYCTRRFQNANGPLLHPLLPKEIGVVWYILQSSNSSTGSVVRQAIKIGKTEKEAKGYLKAEAFYLSAQITLQLALCLVIELEAWHKYTPQPPPHPHSVVTTSILTHRGCVPCLPPAFAAARVLAVVFDSSSLT